MSCGPGAALPQPDMQGVEDLAVVGSSSGVGKSMSFVDIDEDDSEPVAPVNELFFRVVTQLVYSVNHDEVPQSSKLAAKSCEFDVLFAANLKELESSLKFSLHL